MKPKLLLLTVVSLITALLAFRLKEMTATVNPAVQYKLVSKKAIIRCGPDWGSLKRLAR